MPSARKPAKENNMKRLAILSVIVLGLVFLTAGKSVSGGYTYVRLERNGEKTWLACPKMKVTVGENMSFKPGIVMVNFVSKTLKRKFDRIIFSAGPIKSENEE